MTAILSRSMDASILVRLVSIFVDTTGNKCESTNYYGHVSFQNIAFGLALVLILSPQRTLPFRI